MIKLIVIKNTKREDFDDDWEKYQEWKKDSSQYSHPNMDRINCPPYYDSNQILEVELTDAQFEIIKKEVIKNI